MSKLTRGSARMFVVHFWHGFCMGVAEAIPGVNGATIALLFNIYTRIIDAIKLLTPGHLLGLLKYAFLSWRKSHRNQFYNHMSKLEFGFLAPLALGSLFAIWILSGVIPAIISEFPNQSHAFIFGLVAVSVYIPLKQIKPMTLSHFTIIALSFAITFQLILLPNAHGTHSLWLLFIYGAIGACALLLPGLSGSYLLKAFGQYEFILDNLHRLFAFDSAAVTVILVFLCGMITGIILFAKLLSWLLLHYRSKLMAVMAGLTLGSLRAVWPSALSTGSKESAFLLGIMWLGAMLMIFLILMEKKKVSRAN